MNKLIGMVQVLEVISFLKQYLRFLLSPILCEDVPFLQHWSDSYTSQQAMQLGLPQAFFHSLFVTIGHLPREIYRFTRFLLMSGQMFMLTLEVYSIDDYLSSKEAWKSP